MADPATRAEQAVLQGVIRRSDTYVTYRRGPDSVVIQAVRGSQLLRSNDRAGNVKIERTDRDYIFATADLILGGQQTRPRKGDICEETVGDATERFEVAPYEHDPAYRQPRILLTRVHTKFLDRS